MPEKFSAQGGTGAEMLRAEIQDYIAQCNAADIFPDLAGMRLFLGLSREELDKIRQDPACAEALDYAADCRESWLVRRMCQDNKLSNACMNVLRQAENGGYGEKDGNDRGLLIRFSGNIGPEELM